MITNTPNIDEESHIGAVVKEKRKKNNILGHIKSIRGFNKKF